ncbi:MAG: response regulator transcription factor [Halioglobus sp.]|nr:response regulator transcription factor [Halioglobus sp.]
MSTTVLIIDDDLELCSLLCDFLSLETFAPTAVHNGQAALEHCRRHAYDVIVLDVMLPGMQGLDVLRDLRQFSNVPVLMLTARGEDTDRIVGLELGADDYLAKPCNPRELSARLRAVLRRTGTAGSRVIAERLEVGTTAIDTGSRSVTHAGNELTLTNAEFNILKELLRWAGTVVSKDTLSQHALGRSLTAYDRSVDVHVSKIRKKLSAAGGKDLIVSVRGSGYQFRLDPKGT